MLQLRSDAGDEQGNAEIMHKLKSGIIIKINRYTNGMLPERNQRHRRRGRLIERTGAVLFWFSSEEFITKII